MTVGLNSTRIDFRNASLTNGAPTTINATGNLSLVIPAGATLGTTNAVLSRVVLLCLNNAGTAELAVVNQAGGVNLDETGLISTTAISASATSASTIYSTTARTNVPYRVVGFIDSTQATAGQWATAPTLIQGAGGIATASMAGIGNGQSYQTVTRVLGTTYYNTTGKPIFVNVGVNVSSTNASEIKCSFNGATAITVGSNVVGGAGISAACAAFIVAPGESYNVTFLNGGTIHFWTERR
ncbi:MAG: hypothetical protein FGM23_01565 [Alphaproteobacteria bacterium]|nr:hypothetical protein [Alphaproteobacteria bacterium]